LVYAEKRKGSAQLKFIEGVALPSSQPVTVPVPARAIRAVQWKDGELARLGLMAGARGGYDESGKEETETTRARQREKCGPLLDAGAS